MTMHYFLTSLLPATVIVIITMVFAVLLVMVVLKDKQ